jgi:hypothetical protein
VTASDGRTRGHVFHYIDFPESYERIVSADVDRYLAARRPDRVQLLIRATTDFRVLRAYSVEWVDGISVNDTWSWGSPPWDELQRRAGVRQRPPAGAS